MPPQEIAEQFLRKLLDRGASEACQLLPPFPATVLADGFQLYFELYFDLGSLAVEEPSPSGPPGPTVVLQAPETSRPSFATSGQHRWMSIHHFPGHLVLCGVFGNSSSSLAPFALSLDLPADWSYWRQTRHVSRLLTHPFVPHPENASLASHIIPLVLQSVAELVARYPWKGGRIEGTDVRISPKGIPVSNALQFIRQFLHLPLVRADVAHAVGVSESYLTALFKERHNTNLTDYMLLERILRADRLLLHSKLPVASIGAQCGFSSTTYFIRAYRKLRLKTPLKSRQLSRNPIETNEWAEGLFHLEGYPRLPPVSAGEAEGVSNLLLPAPQYPLIIANSSDQPLKVDLQVAPGEFQRQTTLGPLEMQLVWNPAPSAWRIWSRDRLVGDYVTERSPAQILILPSL